jgi:hypothetical protein
MRHIVFIESRQWSTRITGGHLLVSALVDMSPKLVFWVSFFEDDKLSLLHFFILLILVNYTVLKHSCSQRPRCGCQVKLSYLTSFQTVQAQLSHRSPISSLPRKIAYPIVKKADENIEKQVRNFSHLICGAGNLSKDGKSDMTCMT